jgi:hypothetical protein
MQGIFRGKIQIFESKSQLRGCFLLHEKGCLPSQRYKFLKANHNRGKIVIFESKSQQRKDLAKNYLFHFCPFLSEMFGICSKQKKN